VVLLRPLEDGDARRLAEICADPEIARWTNVPSPYTLEDARAFIAVAAAEREHGTGLHLAVVRDGRIAGSVALRLRGDDEPFGDAGYYVAADARRSGVAQRALGLITRLGLGELALPYIEVVVAPENEASAGVARAAGYTERGRELREFKGRLVEFAVWRRDATHA
jgi:RimJ/RimL family protein N-acetyltransferase